MLREGLHSGLGGQLKRDDLNRAHGAVAGAAAGERHRLKESSDHEKIKHSPFCDYSLCRYSCTDGDDGDSQVSQIAPARIARLSGSP